MKPNRVAVMVSPELGLALETRKLDLKKSGIPIKTMGDLIERLLDATASAESADEESFTLSQTNDAEEYQSTGYNSPVSNPTHEVHMERHRKLDRILRGSTEAQIRVVDSILDALEAQIKYRELTGEQDPIARRERAG
jgi:hypothetical protein